MPCIDKIAADILNSCDTIPRSGFETVAWAINRDDIATVTHDTTYDTLVEAITLDPLTVGYNVTAVKKEMNAGFDLVKSDDISDTYLNHFSFKPYEKSPAAIKNLDSMNDLVIIAQLKGFKTEGCFVIYGLENGLYKTTGSQRQNDSHGLPIYEMQSQEGQGERYSKFIFWDTDYATSLAAIELLVDPYGSELNTTASAISDPNGNETDGVAGWSESGLNGTGDNEFSSQETVVDEGDSAFKLSSHHTPTADARIHLDMQAAPFSFSNDDEGIITFRCRHTGEGANNGEWGAFLASSNSGTNNEIVELEKTDDEFISVTFRWIHTANHRYFVIKENSTDNDGGIYIDNLSVKKRL